MAQIVRWGAGEVLDLADHVVAQVADQSGVERGEVGEVGRVEGGQDGLQRGQRPPVPADPVPGGLVEVEVPPGRDRGPPGGDGGQGFRPTKEYRPHRSPPSTDSSRKPVRSSASTICRKAATGVTVSATSSHQTGTIRWRAASERKPASPGPLAVSSAGALTDRRVRGRRLGRNRCGCRCGTPRLRPDPPPPAARRRRSRSGRHGRTVGRRTSRPCTRTPVGCGSRTRCGRSARVRRRDSAFIQANMSTARSEASWTMAPTSPSPL